MKNFCNEKVFVLINFIFCYKYLFGIREFFFNRFQKEEQLRYLNFIIMRTFKFNANASKVLANFMFIALNTTVSLLMVFL